jgi:hypothetical protein
MRCESESRKLRLACADTTQAIREKQSAVPDYGGQFGLAFAARLMPVRLGPVAPYQISTEWFLPIGRLVLDVLLVLRLGQFALLKWREQINRDGKKRGRVMFAGNFAHGLEEA